MGGVDGGDGVDTVLDGMPPSFLSVFLFYLLVLSPVM